MRSVARELAGIERMGNRQDRFFNLLVSAITGFFMFIATFLSGLLLEAMRNGKLNVPGADLLQKGPVHV